MTSTTTLDQADGSPDDIVVDQIVDAFEPVLAAQRHVIAKVWEDRSISKLNLHVLMLLEVHGPQRMGQLAELVKVSLPNMTAMVDRMEQLGLVKRLRDADDRRAVIVRSTARGKSAVKQIESVRRQELRRLVCRLTADEQQLCLKAMQAMSRVAGIAHDGSVS